MAIALLAFLLFAAYRANRSVGTGVGAARLAVNTLPTSVSDVMGNDRATKIQLETAASNAFSAGYTQLADELMKKVDTAPDKVFGFESPWRDVPSDKWTRFVKLMAVSTPMQEQDKLLFYVARGRYGLFLMSVRRLVDLGVMKNPKKDAKGVWTADWAIPKEKFLGDPAFQLKVFTVSMVGLRKQVLSRYGNALGSIIETQPATLSGFLAVAHYAGVAGLGKFLSSELRKSTATEAYKKANQIF